MIAAGFVADMRAQHGSLMTDRCVIDRDTRGPLDAVTGNYADTWTALYSGKCRLKGPHAGAITVTEKQAGEAEQATTWQTLVLPHGSASDVSVGDRVTINAAQTYRVVGQSDSTTMTARSLLVERIEG